MIRVSCVITTQNRSSMIQYHRLKELCNGGVSPTGVLSKLDNDMMESDFAAFLLSIHLNAARRGKSVNLFHVHVDD